MQKRSPFGAPDFTPFLKSLHRTPFLERCPGPFTADVVCPLSRL